MLSLVGNLSEKGLSFFKDPGLRYELYQDSIIDVQQGSSAEIYIGVKHRTENNLRYGKILSLEENSFAFMIDIIKEVQGVQFRDYSNIESISMETTFDARGFLKNLLLSKMDQQVFQVLEFIMKDHISDIKSLETCVNRSETALVSCDSAEGHQIFYPQGWWGQEGWPPGYNFYTDYFYEPGEEDRVSSYEQWRGHEIVNKVYINKYVNSGLKEYNYINNIYPEQTEIMDYRWHYGGYDVTYYEYRINKTYVYNTFQEWYGSGGSKKLRFIADEQTVKGYTDIAKTNTRYVYDRDKHILEELLGPKECLKYDDHGFCTLARYGQFLPSYDEIDETWIIGFDSEEEDDWPEGEVPEHSFIVHYDEVFESYSNTYVNSEAYRALCMSPNSNSINATRAFYSVENFNGKIGGQNIYNNGQGNEYRYFIPFKQFLNEQNWTLDDFMSIYSDFINQRISDLEDAATMATHLQNKDYSEFFDKNHKAPFDGIEVNVPLVPMLNHSPIYQSAVRVDKREVTVDEFGTETFSDVRSQRLSHGDFTVDINKNEFIYAVVAERSIRTFISDFMKVKMVINFKADFPTAAEVKLRISTSDFTFLNEREFEYYG